MFPFVIDVTNIGHPYHNASGYMRHHTTDSGGYSDDCCCWYMVISISSQASKIGSDFLSLFVSLLSFSFSSISLLGWWWRRRRFGIRWIWYMCGNRCCMTWYRRRIMTSNGRYTITEIRMTFPSSFSSLVLVVEGIMRMRMRMRMRMIYAGGSQWMVVSPSPPTDNHTVAMACSAHRGCQIERSYRSWLYGHSRMDLEMNCHGRSEYCTLTLYQTLTTSLWLIQWKNILTVNCFPWSYVGISTNTTNLLVVLFRSDTNITFNRMIQLPYLVPVAIEFMCQWIIQTSHNRYRLEVLRFLSSKHKMSQYRLPGSLSQSFILHSTSLWLTQMQ